MAFNFPATAGQATDGTFTYSAAGITYAWNGESWVAAGAGGSATDLTVFSVTTTNTGTAALSYDSNTGIFEFTPPDLSGYLTAEADTLATVVARGNTTGGNIDFGQNQRARFGANNELQIYEDSTDGVVQVSDGNIVFKTDREVRCMNAAGNTYLAKFETLNNGRVTLYYSNSKKFETTSTGVTVTGALTAGGLTYPTSNGTSGQVLTSDGAGNVSWSTPSGLQTRTTAQATASNVVSNGTANISITTPATYALLKIQTSHAAWVTLYTDTTSRTNDASRTEQTDPTPGSGVIAEVITAGAATQLISPGTIGFNSAGTGTTYAKVVNKSGATASITVTLHYVQLEG